jgi:hypothetical protein
MGQMESSEDEEIVVADTNNSISGRADKKVIGDAPYPEEVEEDLQKFNRLSKSFPTGVKIFCFKQTGSTPVYIGAELTDTDTILDVKYAVWQKSLTHGPSRAGVQPVWRQTHPFSSGRVAMTAVKALLNQGYEMSQLAPEDAIKM